MPRASAAAQAIIFLCSEIKELAVFMRTWEDVLYATSVMWLACALNRDSAHSSIALQDIV